MVEASAYLHIPSYYCYHTFVLIISNVNRAEKICSYKIKIKSYIDLTQETPTLLHVHNKNNDQLADLHSLISTFVVCYLERTTVQLAPCGISIFWLIFVAEQVGLSLTLSETRRPGFLTIKPLPENLPILL